MQSIKPKLGTGLGSNKDKNRGKIFPQLKMKNGKTLDEKFSKSPQLLTSYKLAKKVSLKKIQSITDKDSKGLNNLLETYKAKALIVRPDRFILKTCNSVNDFNQISYLPL